MVLSESSKKRITSQFGGIKREIIEKIALGNEDYVRKVFNKPNLKDSTAKAYSRLAKQYLVLYPVTVQKPVRVRPVSSAKNRITVTYVPKGKTLVDQVNECRKAFVNYIAYYSRFKYGLYRLFLDIVTDNGLECISTKTEYITNPSTGLVLIDMLLVPPKPNFSESGEILIDGTGIYAILEMRIHFS